tara:strand:+ start:3475 stop:3663 length:189 start_codon:yes stop_codon:yes gene_type:complete
MNDSLQVLSENPSIGIATSVGSSAMYFFEVVNPVLTCISLIIGLSVGLITLIMKIKEWRRKP